MWGDIHQQERPDDAIFEDLAPCGTAHTTGPTISCPSPGKQAMAKLSGGSYGNQLKRMGQPRKYANSFVKPPRAELEAMQKSQAEFTRRISCTGVRPSEKLRFLNFWLQIEEQGWNWGLNRGGTRPNQRSAPSASWYFPYHKSVSLPQPPPLFIWMTLKWLLDRLQCTVVVAF